MRPQFLVGMAMRLRTFLFVSLRTLRLGTPGTEPRTDRLPVVDQRGKLTSTSVVDAPLRAVLNQLSASKRRVLILRFGLADGHPLSRVGVARALFVSQRTVSRIELAALGEIGPEATGKLEQLSRPRQPPRHPDSGGYQTSGRPVPMKPIPPSLSAAAEVELPEPDA